MKNYTLQAIGGAVGAVLSFCYGELTTAFLTLIAMICMDFVTGILHAYVEKKLNSQTCARGIAKKVYILVLVAVGHLIDSATGAGVCMNVVTCFYIANEAMSIIENAGKIGLPIPEKLTKALEQLNGGDNS